MWKGFQKPKRLAAELESLTDKYGKFSAQPFERGWGATVGNALRRTLLSSIEGAAITAVRIEGVLHEFSSIAGVVEDATDIILNLKQVPLKLNTDQTRTITLNATQPGVVTSAMIGEDADFAVLDKNVYIATVSEGGKLELFDGAVQVLDPRVAVGLGKFLADFGLLLEVDEDAHVVLDQLGRQTDGILRRDGAVGPHFEHQAVVVGHLPEAGGFHRVVHFADG